MGHELVGRGMSIYSGGFVALRLLSASVRVLPSGVSNMLNCVLGMFAEDLTK